MTTSIKNKMRKVMQLAHRAYQLKSSSMSWVECLKQAWQVVKLESAMKTKVVEFFFMKMNGEVRQAFGTLLQSPLTILQMVQGMQHQEIASAIGMKQRAHGDNSRLTTSCELHKDIFTF